MSARIRTDGGNGLATLTVSLCVFSLFGREVDSHRRGAVLGGRIRWRPAGDRALFRPDGHTVEALDEATARAYIVANRYSAPTRRRCGARCAGTGGLSHGGNHR